MIESAFRTVDSCTAVRNYITVVTVSYIAVDVSRLRALRNKLLLSTAESVESERKLVYVRVIIIVD